MMPAPRLRELRERAFLTQEELATKSGVSLITIARVETGTHKARLKTIRKLAEALGVPPSTLVERQGDQDTGQQRAMKP